MTRNDFLRISAGFVGMTAVPFGLGGCPSDDTNDDGAESANATTTGTTDTSTTDTPQTTTTDTPGTDSTTNDPDSTTNDPDSTSGDPPGTTTDGDSTTGEPSACEADPDVEIGSNHNHELVVPLADVMAAVETSYNIQGTSMHPHTITLTTEHFGMLAQGLQVMVTSSVDNGHDHEVTISCG